jgi:hypothetical protein
MHYIKVQTLQISDFGSQTKAGTTNRQRKSWQTFERRKNTGKLKIRGPGNMRGYLVI